MCAPLQLFLENNAKLTKLPDDFCTLPALEILDLNACALEKLPETFSGLTRLLEVCASLRTTHA